MFYEILSGNKENPTVEELTQGHIELEALKDQIQSAFDAAFNSVILAQQAVLGGQPSKKLTENQKILADLDQKLVSVERGQESIRAKLAERILKDSESRLAEIPSELSQIAEEKKALYQEYLKTCAEAGALLSRIKGIGSNGFLLPDLNFSLLSQTEKEFYLSEFKAKSKDFNPNTAYDNRIHALTGESNKIESMLENFNADESVKAALISAGSGFYPVVPAEEKIPYERRTTDVPVYTPPKGPDPWGKNTNIEAYYQQGEVKFTPDWYRRQAQKKDQDTEPAAEETEAIPAAETN